MVPQFLNVILAQTVSIQLQLLHITSLNTQHYPGPIDTVSVSVIFDMESVQCFFLLPASHHLPGRLVHSLNVAHIFVFLEQSFYQNSVVIPFLYAICVVTVLCVIHQASMTLCLWCLQGYIFKYLSSFFNQTVYLYSKETS